MSIQLSSARGESDAEWERVPVGLALARKSPPAPVPANDDRQALALAFGDGIAGVGDIERASEVLRRAQPDLVEIGTLPPAKVSIAGSVWPLIAIVWLGAVTTLALVTVAIARLLT